MANIAADIENHEGFAIFEVKIISIINVVEASATKEFNLIKALIATVIGTIPELPVREEHLATPLKIFHFPKLQPQQSLVHCCHHEVGFIDLRIPFLFARRCCQGQSSQHFSED